MDDEQTRAQANDAPTRIKQGFSAVDIDLPTTAANAAEITLTERYPQKGFAMNTRSEMIVRIIEGAVVFVCDGKEKVLTEGSVILVPINKPYCWVPQVSVKLYVVSTPPWTVERHRNINE